MTVKNNLIGKKFGKLTVVAFAFIKNKSSYWYCSCECENQELVIVRRNCLTSGNTKSCGCYKREVNKKVKKQNKYEIKNDYVIGHDEKGRCFLIDLDDLERIKPYYWTFHDGYVVSSVNNSRIMLHRFVMNAPDDMVIDHIHHDLSDNRKSQLRICTDHQNVTNKKLAKNNKTGKTGVFIENSKYRAVIFYNGKTIHLGSFDNFDDAIVARVEAEKKYFGEFRNNDQLKE